MTSEVISDCATTSTFSIISNMRFTLATLSRRTRMPLLSTGITGLAAVPLANGVRIGTISVGLLFFNCTTCVTIEPSTGRSPTRLVLMMPGIL